MKKVKITVLKTTLDKELAAEYGAEGLGPCPMLREGQVFYAGGRGPAATRAVGAGAMKKAFTTRHACG